jgi:hypothetical protein
MSGRRSAGYPANLRSAARTLMLAASTPTALSRLANRPRKSAIGIRVRKEGIRGGGRWRGEGTARRTRTRRPTPQRRQPFSQLTEMPPPSVPRTKNQRGGPRASTLQTQPMVMSSCPLPSAAGCQGMRAPRCPRCVFTSRFPAPVLACGLPTLAQTRCPCTGGAEEDWAHDTHTNTRTLTAPTPVCHIADVDKRVASVPGVAGKPAGARATQR